MIGKALTCCRPRPLTTLPRMVFASAPGSHASYAFQMGSRASCAFETSHSRIAHGLHGKFARLLHW